MWSIAILPNVEQLDWKIAPEICHVSSDLGRTYWEETNLSSAMTDAAMLGFVYQHRFVTAKQLHRRFAKEINSFTTAKHHIRRLVNAGHLSRVPVRSVLNSFPHVYITTASGLKVVRAEYEARTGTHWRGSGEERRAARGYGLQFIAHELAVTDTDLRLLSLTAAREDLSLVGIYRRYYQEPVRRRLVRRRERQLDGLSGAGQQLASERQLDGRCFAWVLSVN